MALPSGRCGPAHHWSRLSKAFWATGVSGRDAASGMVGRLEPAASGAVWQWHFCHHRCGCRPTPSAAPCKEEEARRGSYYCTCFNLNFNFTSHSGGTLFSFTSDSGGTWEQPFSSARAGRVPQGASKVLPKSTHRVEHFLVTEGSPVTAKDRQLDNNS